MEVQRQNFLTRFAKSRDSQGLRVASELALSLAKGRTEERLKTIGDFPFMLSSVEAFGGFFSRIKVVI